MNEKYIEGICRNTVLRHDCARNRRISRMIKMTVATMAIWMFVVVAIIRFTVFMQDLAYAERGYYAIGGEWPAVLLFAVVLIYLADRFTGWVVSKL